MSHSTFDREALNARLTTVRLVRLSAMRDDIGGRLQCVSQDMRSDDFEALVARMAVLQDKYEQRRLLDRC